MSMARKIQRARKRSRKDRAWKVDFGSAHGGRGGGRVCFSGSLLMMVVVVVVGFSVMSGG